MKTIIYLVMFLTVSIARSENSAMSTTPKLATSLDGARQAIKISKNVYLYREYTTVYDEHIERYRYSIIRVSRFQDPEEDYQDGLVVEKTIAENIKKIKEDDNTIYVLLVKDGKEKLIVIDSEGHVSERVEKAPVFEKISTPEVYFGKFIMNIAKDLENERARANQMNPRANQ